MYHGRRSILSSFFDSFRHDLVIDKIRLKPHDTTYSHISVCKRDVVAFGVIGCMFIGALVTLSNGRAAHFSVVFCVSSIYRQKNLKKN